MLYFLNIIAFIFFPFRISSNKRCVTVNSVKNSTSMYTSYCIKKKSIFFASFIYTVSREIFAPPLFFRLFHPGCQKANFNASNYLSLNQTMSGLIQDVRNRSQVKKSKITGAKIILFTLL